MVRTLLPLGTNSCRAFILSAILSLRSSMLCGSVACPRLALTLGLGGAVTPQADAEAAAVPVLVPCPIP
ncbi:hypothetical protein GW17_00010817 [Ensete ventricosum]|uniref:Uncharacterized protein n=1 Tax=Ensete ventricosum TaxID=4639 RepID=A0A444FQF1_ENSVE|nr:hypothetical protein B296_00013284 [Ensete ventricosum]RWW24871.1 hypothetical protein GW17_00010817 [Ensete ventricosum]